MARPVGGANQDGAQLVPLFNEDISSTEGQLFPQQSIVAHEWHEVTREGYGLTIHILSPNRERAVTPPEL